MSIPMTLLQRLYTYGSLQNVGAGIQFSLKNRLSDASITRVGSVAIGGTTVAVERLTLHLEDGSSVAAADVSTEAPVPFRVGAVLDVVAEHEPLPIGKVTLDIDVSTEPFGDLAFSVDDSISETHQLIRIPRNRADDYDTSIVEERRRFLHSYTGVELQHLAQYSFDPHDTKGNIENFVGAAQIPVGIAGPLTIHGEHADGDFLIPLATTEGTLVASYSRGMKILNLCGGTTVSVVGDAMQRAPVFVFADARAGREFSSWVQRNLDDIRKVAESTGNHHRLLDIESYLASKMVYLRFNFSTGDAAGQNTVGKATFAASNWIIDHYQGIDHYFLESNLATDKKASHINTLRTRGKRVTAEAVIRRDVLREHMRVEPESLALHHGVANVGAFLAGANNNGLHSANGITALFIATGQDVANVAESSAGLLYAELTDSGDMYLSITIPSLIVATHGGGTSLATQAEALALLGCRGAGKVNKLAEIVAGVVLAGELSLAAAISASDWVASHEEYGRNR